MASTALLSRSLAGDTDHWKTCIPKEPGLPVEPPKDDEGSILDTVRKSYLWKDNTPDLYVPTEVNLVDNKTLVKKYLAKKETMKAKGRSTGDCQDVYTFAIERLSNLTNICHDGPVSRPAKRHLLGDSRLGFRVWQHADVCLHIGARMNRNPLALVIYKVMLGRRKMLHLEHYTNVHNALKPTPGYDCHISSTQASPMDVTQVAANLDQVYLYDCDGDTHTRRHISHCLPYAVVIYARQFLPKPAPADSMMPRSSLLNDSHPSPRTNAQTKQHTLEGNSDEERCSSLSPEGTVAWGHTDFTVTHWRKLLSRRSIEELENVSLTHGKSSENYISEIGSCDQFPNLVVKRVVTHGCPLSVKKAALQWKVRRINKLRPSNRNFSARPRLTHRLLSDRFSEICTNVKYKEAVLSETRKARMKTTLSQHNEILCQLSQSCHAPACLQGELRETEEQDTTSVPVMANSGLHELADAEIVADSTCSPRPRKRKKIARDSGSEGNLWQSQVIEGSRLKVNFRHITSPTSKPSVTCSPNSTTSPSKKPLVTCSPNITTSPSKKPSVTCSPNITTSPSRKPSVTCSPNITTSPSRKPSVTCSPNSTTSSSRKLLATCSPNSTTSSSRKLSVTCSPNSTTSSSRKPSVTCSPNNIMSSSRKPSVTCNPNRLVPYDGSNDECCHGDVEPCSIQTGVSSQVPVLVKQSSDHHESHDNKSVTVAPIQRRHSPVKRCFVDLGSPVRGESYTSTGVKPLCDGTHSGEYVNVQLQAQATGSDVHTDVKHVTKVPATSSDINPTVKVPTTGGDTHATVKHVTKVPATCGDTHAAVIKSVTKAAETGCEIHADVKKLAALMTLESYWSVAEALGTAKRTKTSQRQKSSDRNLEKSSGSKVPRRQSNSSECSKSSKKKSTSCYGVISSMKKTSRKHRKTHRKTSGESVRTSMEDGEVYAVSVSPASVVRPDHSHVSPRDTVSSTSGMAQVSDAVKPSLSGDVERLDSVHVCDMAGGCMHVAGVGVTWSTNTEPVFSAREQPAFHKSIQSSASMMFMLDKPTTKVSGIEVKAVGKETKLDGTEVKLPENESNISEAEVKGFRKQVKLPENEVKLSNYSGEVELPFVGVKQCENVVKLHDTGMSPCNVPCAVYYTDICQSDSGTGDELPLSTHVPVTIHRETNVWQSQAIEGSSLKVSVGRITSPLNKTLFACSPNRLVAYDGSESIQLPWEWSSDHGSRDSKSVANAPIQRGHLPVKQRSCLTADSYTFTGVNPLCDRTHSEECIDVKHVTEVAASDELSCSKRVAAPLTPESYWSVAEAICTATRTKSCQRQKTSDRNSEKSSGSKVLHGQSNRMASSKSPNKMKVSETEVKVPGKEVKLPEKQMNVSDAKRKVFDKERKPDTQLLEDKVSNTNGKVFGKEGKPSTQLKLPENKTKVSDIKRKMSNKEGNPSTQVQLSENETKVSDTKWKVFGKEVKSAGTQLKLPENKLKVSDTKRKLFGKEGKPGTQLKAPENVKVSAMACKEPKTMKVKLTGMEMKPCKIVMSSCDDPCAVYYTDIGQPDSGTDDDGFSQKVGDSASRPPFPQTCDHLTRKEGPKSDKMANFFANSSLYIYLRQKLSGKGQSEETITTSDFTPSLPESPIPVGRVAETRSVKPSTSTYVQARDASQNLTDTDLKNGDTISRKGFPEMLALVDGVSETYCVKPSTLTYVPPRAVSQNVTDTDLTNGDTVSRRGFPELLAPVGRVPKTHHVKPSASTYAPPRTASQNVTDTDLTNGDSVSRRGFPELLQPMDSVSETCRGIPSTSTHVPTRAVSQNVNIDLTNVDTSRRGTGGTRSKIWCVSSCLGKQGEDKKEVSGKEKPGRVRGSTGNSIQQVSWSGKVNSGRVEETTGNNMQQGKNWAAGKFHGRTLLSGEDVPARMIPFHPLYLFHPIRRSGRPEEIPRDPRPAHYVRKQIQLSSQQLASLLGVTRKDVTFGGSADKAATGVLRPKCGAHGTGSATNRVVHRHAQLLFNDGGDYTNVQAGDEDMDLDSS